MPLYRYLVITAGVTPVSGGTSGSVLFVDSAGTVNQDNANFFWDNTDDALCIGGTSAAAAGIMLDADGSAVINEQGNSVVFRVEGDTDANLITTSPSNDRVGIGTTGPTAKFFVTGAQPASVGTTPGTQAPNIVGCVGMTGGDTTIATTGTGGIGSAISINGGVGGKATAALTLSTGGTGGPVNGTGGTGGAADVTPNATSKTGGAGGAVSWSAGDGGAATGAATGTNTGGTGGAVNFLGGDGGAASDATTANVGGTGGGCLIKAGNGGVGVTSGGNGGNATLQGGGAAAMAGAAGGQIIITSGSGSSTGTGGNGGALSLTGGDAGGDETVNRTGSTITISAGDSKGGATGGAITGTAGPSGASQGTGSLTGGTGGAITWTAGAGGTVPNATTTGTGGVGGAINLNGAAGGAAAGTGATTNNGGVGGAVNISAGTGGAASGASGVDTGGVGGGVVISAGAGGAGDSAAGNGGTITFRTAATTSLATRVTIDRNGLVGIGNTPATILDMTGADNSTVQTVRINATQANVTAADVFIDFRSTTGSEGTIAGTAAAGVIAYNTFTGSHFTLVEDRTGLEVNMLLEALDEKITDFPEQTRIVKDEDGNDITETFKASVKAQLFKARICTTKNSKAAIGVYGGTDKEGRDLMFSLGTGFIWVANTGKNVELGDYLVSSDTLGCAEPQADDVYRNTTIAKATQSINWLLDEKKRLISCIYLGG